jgi:hypothetical protein
VIPALELPLLDLRLAMADVYDGVAFASAPE